ncbi:CehA/McbA family metallohydrolase [Martelella endophytica]|uniref:CehA/McbA family metallohydrolase n=1 Tax=Martelella endophytica TaxID=1486262 RepID=UPI000698AC5A|nr:CehA/McbA family metallohydrolase [Martelella endophytica]
MQIIDTGLSLAGTRETTFRVERDDQARSPYLYVAVDVPSGLSSLSVTLAYEKGEDCIIDLGLLDPRASAYPTREGFRGWSGGARNAVFVGEKTATPGYVPGAIMAGRWLVMLGLYRLPEAGAEISLTVGDTPIGPAASAVPEATRWTPKGPGWYRGDTHSHTFHSDAKGAPETLHRMARERGLDFLFVTDHNTLTGWTAYFRNVTGSDLVFLPGVEITTADGHANILGLETWVDFRLERDEDIAVLEASARSAGGILSVNHHKPPIPWRHAWPEVKCMEAWHECWDRDNALLLSRYDALLKSGRRITGIGGSDYHQPAALTHEGAWLLGNPTTVVHAETLDRTGVVEAIRRGRVFITESPDGPHLELEADGQPMGGVVAASKGVVLNVLTEGAKGDGLHLVSDRGLLATLPVGSGRWQAEMRLPSGLLYVRAEIRRGKAVRALSNPIYFDRQMR